MTGEYRHSLDNKGRVFIPARLRDELGPVFYVTPSADPCLNIYSEENWQRFVERVNAMPYIQQRKLRPLFAHAARLESDGQGRALLPQNLRDFAHLGKEVAIIGCNNHVEVWDSVAWDEVCAAEMTPENIASIMEELAF